MTRNIIYLLSISVLYSCLSKKTIKIKEDEVGIVGYGSLISLKSFESTLGRTYSDSTYRVHLLGYRRKWDFVEKDDSLYGAFTINGRDTTYIKKSYSLNIIDESASKLNGILYIISKSDLNRFDLRESGYVRIDVTDRIEEYLLKGGRAFTYQALPENIDNDIESNLKENALDIAYVTLVFNACDSLGEDFKKEFYLSTDKLDSLILKELKWK